MPSGCARIPTSSISITIFRPVLFENSIRGLTIPEPFLQRVRCFGQSPGGGPQIRCAVASAIEQQARREAA
jgi:hypothetical protein